MPRLTQASCPAMPVNLAVAFQSRRVILIFARGCHRLPPRPRMRTHSTENGCTNHRLGRSEPPSRKATTPAPLNQGDPVRLEAFLAVDDLDPHPLTWT